MDLFIILVGLNFFFFSDCTLNAVYFFRFKIKYENAILRGNDKNASHREKHIGSMVAKV